eukprot:EG_transcript_25645
MVVATAEVTLRPPSAASVAAALAALPAGAQRQVTLDLSGQDLGDAEVERVVAAVVASCTKHPQLHIAHLDVRHNAVSDAGAGHLAYLLGRLRPLPRVVDVSGNRLSAQGFACLSLALLAAYRKMPTNVTIHVDNNVIDSDIAMLVLDAMAADAPPAWCDVEGEEGEGGRHTTGPAVRFTGLRQPATGAWSDEGASSPREVEGEEIVFAPPVDVW